MLKAVVLALAVILFGASVVSANAHPKTIATVQDLYDACRPSSDNVTLQTCDVYIQGIKDLMELTGLGANDSSVSAQAHDAIVSFAACNVPNTEQVRQAFVSWSEKGPNYRTYPSAMGVWIVISQNWPCPLRVPLEPPH